jgi:NADH-quinone oxidoreductase E subunit
MECTTINQEDDLFEETDKIDEILEKHQGQKEALIQVLTKVQDLAGYLPESLLRRIADALQVPLSRVYGVVTFYSYFTMTPRGKHPIRICLGTACHVRGAMRNYNKIVQHLGIEQGEVTPDRRFGLEVVRCLGACGLAPVMTVDKETHRQVKETQLESILNRYSDK